MGARNSSHVGWQEILIHLPDPFVFVQLLMFQTGECV